MLTRYGKPSSTALTGFPRAAALSRVPKNTPRIFQRTTSREFREFREFRKVSSENSSQGLSSSEFPTQGLRQDSQSVEADRVILPDSAHEAPVEASSHRDQQDQQKAARRRRQKGAKLLLILNSGSRIEEVIEEHKYDIDREMMEMLEARIEAAREGGEHSIARGLVLIHQRLVAELQRLQASGTERLLDALLQTMAANRGLETEVINEELEDVLIEGFGAPSNSHIDIFAAAAQLAAGGEVQGPEGIENPVTPTEFMREARHLLQEAEKYQDELKQVASKRPADVAMDKLERIVEERASMIADLRHIIQVAANVQLG